MGRGRLLRFGCQKVNPEFFTISCNKYTERCGFFNEFFVNIVRGIVCH